MEELKHLWVVFTCEGRIEWGIDRLICSAAGIMLMQNWSAVVKKTKLLIYP